jgi:outer membrane protein, multidrug efflux system
MAFQKYREYRAHEQALAAAAQDAARLSELRYRGGAASYLEVLTNETNYYTAEIGLARAQLSERLSLVQVYQALGGGWEQ